MLLNLALIQVIYSPWVGDRGWGSDTITVEWSDDDAIKSGSNTGK